MLLLVTGLITAVQFLARERIFLSSSLVSNGYQYLSPGVKQIGHEADQSPPPIAEARNAWSYTSNPPVGLHGLVLN
jgi:hypothetical protein